MRWHPNVTVAAVIEKDGRFLIVEEEIDGEIKLNQPAGHWEYGESLVDAVKREVLEETAWEFEPQHLIGIYQWQHPELAQTTYLRFSFGGQLQEFNENLELDEGIIQAVWLSRDELIARQDQHRSPQLIMCIDDYLAGQRAPLDLLKLV